MDRAVTAARPIVEAGILTPIYATVFPMPSNLLVLCPSDPYFAPARQTLVQRLSAAGFLGEALPDSGFFKPGADFFQFITFLGCSPVVALGEPGATAEICRIEIPFPSEKPTFSAGLNLKEPRCPSCGFRLKNGREVGAKWQQDQAQNWVCPSCEGAFHAPQLNWRRSAGFGRFFLKVWGVFEGEAVPSESLGALLSVEGGKEWFEFYLQTL